MLELATFFTGPLVGSLLADLGADVVKVEPPGGDPYRSSPSLWPVVGRNKRSLVLDLAAADAPLLLHELLEHFDVLIENLSPAALDRLQLGPDQCAARHPALLVMTVTAFGEGPYADRPGNGTLAEAFVGLTALSAEEGRAPRLPAAAGADVLAAAFGVIGILAAAIGRLRHGNGEHVELACFEPLLHTLASSLASLDDAHQAPMSWAPLRGAFETADHKWLVVACTSPRHEQEITALCSDRTEQDAPSRFREWVRQEKRDSALEELLRRRIPVSPVNSLAEFVNDRHVQYRSSVVELSTGGRRALIPSPVPRIGTKSRRPTLPPLGDVTVGSLLDESGPG